MHIFISGAVHTGKTTAIQRSLSLLGQPCLGGFRSVSVPTMLPQAKAEVYVIPAQQPPCYDRDHLLGIRWGDDLFTSFPQAFERGGLSILQNCPAEASLLLMDELGMMEEKAPSFCREVLTLLDGSIPILGVIKPKAIPFLDAVRSHPRVALLELLPENRDQLPFRISELLRPWVKGS
ncbi:MAG: nucleoside-triphosphatase [Bacillota bacterium]|nr:nucleoside-triphosphatase [Bacillota bacterium]